MKKTSLVSLTLIALMGILLAACSSSAVDLSGEWKLVSYGDANNPIPAIPDLETSLSFGDDDKFGGTVGCNSFGADVTREGNTLQFGMVISTMMFCDASMEQETAVLGILNEATFSLSRSGERLTLTSEDGASVIVLEKK